MTASRTLHTLHTKLHHCEYKPPPPVTAARRGSKGSQPASRFKLYSNKCLKLFFYLLDPFLMDEYSSQQDSLQVPDPKDGAQIVTPTAI